MASEIIMPPLSQTTDEVTLIGWLVKEGDRVNRGDPLCEVETDKVIMEVESFTGGTVLKICSEPDTVVAVGSVIAVVGKPGEKVPDLTVGAVGKTAKADEFPDGDRQPPAKKKPEQEFAEKISLRATPLVKKIAKEKNIDLSQVTGTGPRGSIIRKDIEAYMQSLEKPATVPAETNIKATLLVRNLAKKRNIHLQNVTGTGPEGLIIRADLDNFEKSRLKTEDEISQPAPTEAGEVLLSRNQFVVAKTLAKSKAEIPHYYLKSTVYTDNLFAWRERHAFPDGSKISVTSMLIYALAKTLRRHPKFNSYFKQDRIVLQKEININCAVAAGDELYVPVIKTADLKEIKEIDTELKWLVAKVRNGKVESQDILGGTFTITNLGMYAVDEFGAIINPPQAGIIAVGKMEKRLHIDDTNRMAIRTACTVTGSFDHRIVNGALGAEFMSTLKQMIKEL